MNNELFKKFWSSKKNKGIHLSRRPQKLHKEGGIKRLKWKTHQRAKNIIKQNSTSIFQRTLVFGTGRRHCIISLYYRQRKQEIHAASNLWSTCQVGLIPKQDFVGNHILHFIPFLFRGLFCSFFPPRTSFHWNIGIPKREILKNNLPSFSQGTESSPPEPKGPTVIKGIGIMGF